MDNFYDYISVLYDFNSKLLTQQELNRMKYEIVNDIGDVSKIIDDLFKLIDITNKTIDGINHFIHTNFENMNNDQYDELNNYVYNFNQFIHNVYDTIPPVIPSFIEIKTPNITIIT